MSVVQDCFDQINVNRAMFKNTFEARNAFINLLKSKDAYEQSKYHEYDALFGLNHPEEDIESDLEELASIEFSNSQDSLHLHLEDGWTEDIQLDLLLNQRHKKFLKNLDYPEEVVEDIQRSAIQILGRCNNPKQWGSSNRSEISTWKMPNGCFSDNKKGLVYGMVQSGKTASMLMLTDLALCSGFNFIIHLSSDKESLRDQTQERINKLFSVKGHESKSHGFFTPTASKDYVQAFQKNESVLVKYDQILTSSYVICIKKQKDNLSALLNDLKALRENAASIFNVEFQDLVRCLIIDDEADYASQNNSKKDISTINKLLTDIRKTIVRNDYVGYTATPQACFGANKSAIVGYPSDFVYPISPLKGERGHLSYCGHYEFFQSKDAEHVITLLEDDCWIHWSKDNEKPDIHIPGSEKAKRNFKMHEREFIESLEKTGTTSKTAKAFREALKNYLISTSIMWFRHSVKEGVGISDLKAKINERKVMKSSNTKSGHREFPHTAMMFNAVLENDGQEKLKKLINNCINDFLEDLSSSQSIAHFFKRSIDEQFEKSRNMDCSVPTRKELLPFLRAAIDIVLKDTYGNGEDIIYLLNSSDDGQNIKYDTYSNLRPKRAAVFIGGHMLGRGITIEGLITSVFLRSQSASMMDTNLQMCRWFGHKRAYFDLCSLYIQRHNFNLFSAISEADIRSRKALRDELLQGKSGHELMNVLFGSSLFRLTSPNKNQNTVVVSKDSLGGKTISLRGVKVGEGWKGRAVNFISLVNELIQEQGYSVSRAHNRGFVIKGLTEADFQRFEDIWPSNSLDGDKFREVRAILSALKNSGVISPISFGLLGASYDVDNEIFSLGGLDSKPGIDVNGNTNMPRRAINELKGSVKSLSGGSTPKYAGDRFLDISSHVGLEHVKVRQKSHGILVLFYILNAQYISKKESDKLPENHELYSEKGMLAAVICMPKSSLKETVVINVANLG